MAESGGTDVIDDLVVLGRAGPELIQDGRHTVCLGGWSESKGFVRLYPTHRYTTQAKRWNIIKAPVEQDESHDWRNESWKIVGSKKDWDSLYKKVKEVGRLERRERIELVKEIPKACPIKLNEEKKSMGMVKPEEIHDAYLKEVENPEPVQTNMQGDELRSKNSYPYKLYIEYTCSDCQAKSNHNQHCIEWGIYRWWDKSPDKPEQVIENLRLMDDDWKKYFFVGNMWNNPTSFIIISIMRWKKDDVYQQTMTQFK